MDRRLCNEWLVSAWHSRLRGMLALLSLLLAPQLAPAQTMDVATQSRLLNRAAAAVVGAVQLA